jgi:hypothetical protein
LLDSPEPKSKRGRGKNKGEAMEFSPQDNLDMLTDRVAIWQAIDDDADKFLKRPGDDDRDWMRVFCEDEVKSL